MWFAYALLCAASLAVADLISKSLLSSGERYMAVAFGRWFYSAIFLLPLAMFHAGEIAEGVVNWKFAAAIAVLIPLEIAAVLLYMKAYSLSDLSLSAPFQSFTPLFAAAVSFVVIGESLSVEGAAGVMLVVAGAYVMGTSIERGFLSPFKALLREKGPVYMLEVAFIYGITSVLGKVGVLSTGGAAFAGFYIPVLSVAFAAFLALRDPESLRSALSFSGRFILLGLFMAVMVYTHFKAIELIEVAYMISVKRLSMVIAVFLGHFVLGEGRFLERLAGGVIMFAGAVLIALSS